MIEYKGYLGVVVYDPELDVFHGSVCNTNDVITFYGSSVTELREEMKNSIETYFEFCQEQEKTPEEPFSGKLQIQTTPELHQQVVLNAARKQLNLNVYLQELLERGISTG